MVIYRRFADGRQRRVLALVGKELKMKSLKLLGALLLGALFIGAIIAAVELFIYVFCAIICIAAGYVVINVIADACRQIKKGE